MNPILTGIITGSLLVVSLAANMIATDRDDKIHAVALLVVTVAFYLLAGALS